MKKDWIYFFKKKKFIWRVCISMGCEFAYFNNNLPSFCLICAQLAIKITLSWIDYHWFNKPFIICRYNNGTSLDKDGINVLFLEIGVAWLVINFIPLYFPVPNMQLNGCHFYYSRSKPTTSCKLHFLLAVRDGYKGASVGQIPWLSIQHAGMIFDGWKRVKWSTFFPHTGNPATRVLHF